VEIRYDDRIYEASPGTLFTVISEIEERFASAMLVGHNPGMEGLIRQLTGRIEPMPTAALAVIDLDLELWKEAAPGIGRLVAVARPKALM
jgi:phosphohistidine phosphatase